MFNQNDVFNSAAALRSVTDWAPYDDGYASNVLNSAVLDPYAYKKSIPICFVENFSTEK